MSESLHSTSRTLHISRLPSYTLLQEGRSPTNRLLYLFAKPQLTDQTVKQALATSNADWQVFRAHTSAEAEKNNIFICLVAETPQEQIAPINDLLTNQRNCSLESQIAHVINQLQSYLTKPYQSYQTSVTDALPLAESSCSDAQKATAHLESIRIKSGQQSDFFDFCHHYLHTKIDNKDFGFEIHKHLNNLNTLHILYHFHSSQNESEVRGSPEWQEWRRRMAVFLVGPPRGLKLRRIIGDESSTSEGSLSSFKSSSGEMSPTNRQGGESGAFESEKSAEVFERAVQEDKKLKPFGAFIRSRYEQYASRFSELVSGASSLDAFADAHLNYGVHKVAPGQVRFREYLPTAVGVWIFGDFNNWQRDTHALKQELDPLTSEPNGIWSLVVANWAVKHRDRYKLIIRFPQDQTALNNHDSPPTAEVERVSIWSRALASSAATPPAYDGLIWFPQDEQAALENDSQARTHDNRCPHALYSPAAPEAYSPAAPEAAALYSASATPAAQQGSLRSSDTGAAKRVDVASSALLEPTVESQKSMKAYEVHIGVSSSRKEVATFRDCQVTVLPWMKCNGFDTLILTALQEHAYFGSGGWHVTAFFAVTNRYGSPHELRTLIRCAHQMDIRVVMSIIVSHTGPNYTENLLEAGILNRSSELSRHKDWDSWNIDYSAGQWTQKFGLSLIRYFMDDFDFDGFRVEGLGSLLHKDNALNGGHDRFDYPHYFSDNANVPNHVFLMLLNELVHSKNGFTIASDATMTPGIALPISAGGLGFDYKMAHNVPPALCKLIQLRNNGKPVQMSQLRWELDRLNGEQRLVFTETLETNTISKRPLRIAFFAWETLHTIAVGGIAPHVTELAAGLRRIGHHVHIFTRATGIAATESTHYGVHYHEVTFNLNRDFVQECANMCAAFVAAMLEYESRTGNSFNIIHGHDWLAARAVTALKGLGRTCIFTMHSTESGRCGNQTFGGDSARIRNVEWEACNQADRVICVSGVLAEEVCNIYKINPDKLRVVYNGINVQNFDGFEDAAPIKKRYGIDALQPTILFVGRLVLQKGVDLLVEAIPFILKFRGDIVFVVVGDGHMRKDVEARANQLGVSHAIRFVGSKKGGELISLFKMCDAVIVPSRNEPFGIVVLEAWSAFKPVIATTRGGPRDFVTPNVDGILVDPEPGSIAWGVCEVIKNFDHARWMGERGRVKAAFSFSWDEIAIQTRNVYYEIIGRSDAAYGISPIGDCSLAQRTLGDSVYEHMTIFDDNTWIRSGLLFLRLISLLTYALGGESKLVSMGSEFAHPDWIDFPRKSNNFSYLQANRQWSLALRKGLKYKHMLLFNRILNAIDGKLVSPDNSVFVSKCSEEDQILVFEKGHCVFVINMNAERSFESYGIGHSLTTATSGQMRLLLNTDELRFGGWGRIDTQFALYPKCLDQIEGSSQAVKLYIPSHTGMVLVPVEVFDALNLENDPVLAKLSPDQLIDDLKASCRDLASVVD